MGKQDRHARNAVKTLRRTVSPAAIVAWCLVVPVFFTGCAKKIKRADPVNINVPDNKIDFLPEYDMEGFISDDHFRIIIIEPKGASEPHLPAIEKTGRQRALASLQKYLLSRERVVDRNATAALISIIGENGKLVGSGSDSESRLLFYYEIRMEGLRERIDRLSKKR